MFRIIKKTGKRVAAYRLGDSHEVLDRLISEGKIIPRDGGVFEIMSEEAFAGESGRGEIVHAGDFIKLSGSGFPYPNREKYFTENHIRISGDEYELIPKPFDAWDLSEPMCEEIEFLIEEKGLVIDPSDAEKCFSAPLFGTREAAPRDAVIVLYSVTRDPAGKILDADFNFIVRPEFNEFYDRLPQT